MIALTICLGFLFAGFIPLLAQASRQSPRTAFLIPFMAAGSAGSLSIAATKDMNEASLWMFGIGILFAVVMCVLAVAIMADD